MTDLKEKFTDQGMFWVSLIGCGLDSDLTVETVTALVTDFDVNCNRYHCVIAGDICPRFAGTFGRTIVCRKEKTHYGQNA